MDRFPIIITLGGMLLGWIAGSMVVTDPAVSAPLAPYMSWLHLAAPLAGALLVLILGRWQANRVAAANQSTRTTTQNQPG
jgi:predicted tellurium resistance membrane protein TerC